MARRGRNLAGILAVAICAGATIQAFTSQPVAPTAASAADAGEGSSASASGESHLLAMINPGRSRLEAGLFDEVCNADTTAWRDAVDAEFRTALGPSGAGLARLSALPRPAAAPAAAAGSAPCIRPPGRPFITAMVLYTGDARQQAHAAGEDIEAEIKAAVEEANRTYAVSGIHQRLSLSYVGEIDYPESGERETDMTRLIRTQTYLACYLDGACWSERKHSWFWWDPSFDLMEAHVLRNRYSADLVNLWRARGGGASRTMTEVDVRFESQAFSIVKRKSALVKYSFAHEIAHNMGARHDVAKSLLGSGVFPDSHGYVSLSGGWRTIMAHGVACRAADTACPRIGLWSNPDRNFRGEPTGDRRSDNRRTLNRTASVVARFRTLGENEDGDDFGRALASGDFDGDGFTDLAVGAPGDPSGDRGGRGRVYLYKGTPHGLAPWTTLATPGVDLSRGGGFGAVLVADDLDGDGKDDLRVGSLSRPETGSAGKSPPMVAFAGTDLGLAPWPAQGSGDMPVTTVNDQSRPTVAEGDFNGDGIPDVAIGVSDAAPSGPARSGAVFVLANDGREYHPYQVLHQEQ